MKKIWILALCLIMTALSAAAEDYSNIMIEQIQLSAAELGFDGANGNEIIIYAGNGYYLLWREDLYGPFIYEPKTGWHLIDAHKIDDEWASSTLYAYYVNIFNKNNPALLEHVGGYEDKGDAYISYFAFDNAIKYDNFIYVDTIGGIDYWVDLNDFSAVIHANSMALISSRGKMWQKDTENEMIFEVVDINGNIINKYDLSNLDVRYLEFVFEDENDIIVVYEKNTGGHYAAWLNENQEIICQNCLIPAGTGASEACYSSKLDALIYGKRVGPKGNILIVSYKNGTQKVLINNGVDLIAKEYSEITFDEKGGFEKEDEKTYSIKLICLMEDEIHICVCTAVDYKLYNREKYVESYIVNINTMECTKIRNSDEISNMLECAVSGRNDNDIIYGNGLSYIITK